MRTDSDHSPISPRTTTEPTQPAASHRAAKRADVPLHSSLQAASSAAVVRSDWAVNSEQDTGDSDPGLESYRAEVREFVVLCKTKRIPPERVIVELKATLHASLRKQGIEREELRLRQVLIATFIDAYYALDQRR